MICEVASYFGTRKNGFTPAFDGGPVNLAVSALKLVRPTVDSNRSHRIALVAGTRPEIIKMAPIYHSLTCGPLDVKFIATGQHKDMARQALEAFNITPDVTLDCLEGAATLVEIQARLMLALAEQFKADRPDLIVVQGDTSSAFVGALVGFNMEIPVAHVEAGLSSARRYDPYPEEMLRTLIREMASMHFAPTRGALQNLQAANVPQGGLYLTGNTSVDAAQCVAATESSRPAILDGLEEDAPIVLVTTHRREAWGAGIESICTAVSRLAMAHPEITFVWPVHLNPRVADTVRGTMSGFANVRLTEPLGYKDFIGVLSRSRLALTDSGGVQEEAPSFGVPVLVMRDVTERPEAVECGLARLVGKDATRIFEVANSLLSHETQRLAMAKAENPFGDGRSGPRIAHILEERFAVRKTAAA